MDDSPRTGGSLRERNRAATHKRILEATVEITRETGAVNFSMPAVAERSGVALRTLYRYFPTRQQLVDELSSVADQVEVGQPPQTASELEAWLIVAWRNLLDEEALLRAQHMGASGAAIRAGRAQRHRVTTDQLIAHLRPDLDEKARTDLVDLVLLLGSSTALFEFVDVIGVTVERGAQLAGRAIRTLIESA